MMKLGSKVLFTFLDEYGTKKQVIIILGKEILDRDEMSDYEVRERLIPDLQNISIDTLCNNGFIFAARNLLLLSPNAEKINIAKAPELEETDLRQLKKNNTNNSGGGIVILAIVAIILAVVCFPLFVILGMRGKFVLKKIYEKCQGDAYKDFVNKYTIVGIVLYAVVIIMVIVDKIFQLNTLITPAFGILFWGGVVYFVVSWILVKKVFLNNGDLSSLKLFSKTKQPARKNSEKSLKSQREPVAANNHSDSETSVRYTPISENTTAIGNPNAHNTVSHGSSGIQRPKSSPQRKNSSEKSSNSSSRVPTTASRGSHSKGRYAKTSHRNSRKTALIIIILCIVLILVGFGYVFLIKAPRNETNVITPNESASTQSETPTKPETAPQQETDEVTETKNNTPVQEKELSINEYVGYWRISGNRDKELTILSSDSNTVHFSLWYAAKGTISDASAQLQDNIASFSLAVDGTVVKGMLIFNQNAITVQITHSTHASIPIEVMEFTELYMTSQAYIEETEAVTEPENAPLSPYTFKIKDDFHGIYSSPSYESSYVDGIPTGKYTIVEEQYDDRNNLWGKLKSGTGWICLTGINESKATAGYLLPFSSVRLLTEKDISSLTTSQLRFARNEIFARHGRLFDDKGLQDYFNKKAWYSGYIKPSDFSESVLSDIELKNVAFIRAHQQSASPAVESKDVTAQQSSNAAWQTAYLECLKEFESNEYCSFELVYVDADSVPELVINGPSGSSDSDIYSYKGGKLVQQYVYDGYYILDSGLVYSQSGRMGYYPTEIYRLTSSGFTAVFNGLQEERCIVDENGVEQFVFEYTIDGLAVSEDDYNAAVANLFDISNATPLSGHALPYQQITLEILNWK